MRDCLREGLTHSFPINEPLCVTCNAPSPTYGYVQMDESPPEDLLGGILRSWTESVGGGEIATFVEFNQGPCLVIAFNVACMYPSVDAYWDDDQNMDSLSHVEIEGPGPFTSRH